MKTFVWAFLWAGVFEVAIALWLLFRQEFIPSRTPGSVAFNAAMWAGVVGWALWLLAAVE